MKRSTFMKRKSLLLLPICLILSGCKFNMFGRTITLFEKKNSQQNEQQQGSGGTQIDDIVPEDAHQHATSMSTDPNAPFYLKVGETRSIKVTLSPSPELDEEKVCEWTKKGDFLDYVVDSADSRKVTVTGKAPGTTTLTAKNTYNDTLTKSFTINVIDFDEEKDYLWQYQSSDRAQFGYENTDELKRGTAEGDANLNGMIWHYTRSRVTSLQSSMGAVGFGKGTEPEEHVHLETEVDRDVNKFTIEAASANSLATMTIKIGETVYMNEKVVPKDYYDVIGKIESDEVTRTKGKIEIDVITPSYDSYKAENEPGYKAPGAFYLKSILINFNEAVPPKTLTKVKAASEIVAGRYLIIGQTTAGIGMLDGSLTSANKDHPLFLEDFELNDEVQLPGTYTKYAFVASFDENEKLNFTSDTGIKIGLANSGTLSTTKAPALLGWDYTMDAQGHLDMSMVDKEDTPKTKHFGANEDTGKFSAYASAKNNIFLYKF